MSPHRAWLFFFGIWTLILTGLLDFWLESPGLKQWYRVESSLKEARQNIVDIENRTLLQNQTIHQLETNPVAQEREIRKVLGYLASDEIVFEFGP